MCDDLEKSKIIYDDQIYTVAKESCYKKSNDHKYLQEQLKVNVIVCIKQAARYQVSAKFIN